MALEDDALRLGKLDRQVVRALLENDIEEFPDALAAFFELRKDLRTRLLDEPVVSV